MNRLKKVKVFFMRIMWFFNPYKYFVRRRNLKSLSSEVMLNRTLLDTNRHQTIEHMKAIASIKSNITTYKKTVGEKFKELPDFPALIHQFNRDIAKLEQKSDQWIALIKEMDKKVKNLHNKMDRIIKIEDEIDLLDKKKRENQDIFAKHTMLFHDHANELKNISEQFKEAMAIQGRSAVYALQGKKNEFIKDFELFLAKRDGYGRERETDQANP